VDLFRLAQVASSGGSCEYGDVPSGSTKGGEYLD